MISDVKRIFLVRLLDQIKELNDSGTTSSSHDLFVKRGKSENK